MTALMRIERFDEEVEVIIEGRVTRLTRDELEVGDVEAYLPSGHLVPLTGREEDQAVRVLLDRWSDSW